jgi:hypothetical protein
VAQIRFLIGTGVPLNDAREQAARTMVASPRFVFRAPTWTWLRAAHGAVMDSIQALRRPGEDISEDAVRTRLQATLRTAQRPDFSLDAFLDREFSDRRSELWDSYFATLILGGALPQQKVALLGWIRLFAILDALRRGQAHQKLIAGFDLIRPVAPLLVAGRAARRPLLATTVQAPADPPIDLAALQAMRASVVTLTEIAGRLERRVSERLTGLVDGEPADSRPDPLRVAAGDLTTEERAALTTAGIAADGRQVNAVLADIYAAASRARSRLRLATRVDVPAVVDGVLVRRSVRRSIGRPGPDGLRTLQPGPHR